MASSLVSSGAADDLQIHLQQQSEQHRRKSGTGKEDEDHNFCVAAVYATLLVVAPTLLTFIFDKEWLIAGMMIAKKINLLLPLLQKERLMIRNER